MVTVVAVVHVGMTSPCSSQTANAGVRRPGYEAITPVLKTVTGVTILCTVDIALAWLWPTGLFHILEKKKPYQCHKVTGSLPSVCRWFFLERLLHCKYGT